MGASGIRNSFKFGQINIKDEEEMEEFFMTNCRDIMVPKTPKNN